MKKNIQRLGLALIIGSLALITGCGGTRNDNQMQNKMQNKMQKTERPPNSGQTNGSCGSCGSCCN